MGDKYYKEFLNRKKVKRSPIYRVGMMIFGVLILVHFEINLFIYLYMQKVSAATGCQAQLARGSG